MFNQPTHKQRRLQYALIATGFIGAAAGIITFFLMAMVFMLAGLQYGHPLALFMGHLHMTPFTVPQGTLDGGAWLMLIAAYASLLVSLPAFFILYLGGNDAS